MRSAAPRYIGVGAVLLGVAVYMWSVYWMKTRTFVALDMPVPLAQRHFSTGDFKINLRDSYWIGLDSRIESLPPTGCPPTWEPIADWVLYENGKVVPQENGHWRGYFHSNLATYKLEVDVKTDPVCLAALHPRLRVSTYNDYGDLHGLIRFFAAVFVVAGLCIFIRSLVPYRRPWAQQQLGLDELAASYPRPGWSQRLRLNRPFDANPGFGFIAAATVLCVLAPVWILTAWLNNPDYKGFYVLITTPKPNPLLEVKEDPIIVSVHHIPGDDRTALYVGSRPVEWADLSKTLRAELAQRANRIVYIKGDDNLWYQDVAQVVDIAREAWPDVPVVLTTAKLEHDTQKVQPRKGVGR